MFDQLEVYQDTEPRAAAMNMAVDEALLESASSPALRFYGWQRPALSIGYFGSFAEVSSQFAGRDIVRRWTGGGVVSHGEDLTYSAVIPKDHPLFALSSSEIYTQLHNAIRQVLAANGVDATLATSVAPKVSDECFANAVRADVLSQGRKIAGAAHRRSRAGLLHQGSIQFPGLPDTFMDDFAVALCDRFERTNPSRGVIDRANALAETKYGTAAWLMRR